jgi:hypothetical protein
MNLENIIVIGICLAAIAIITFYFYNKLTAQKKDLIALSQRCEIMEMILTKPPSQNEISQVYNRTQQKQNLPEQNLIHQKCEIEGLCDLQPLQIETNDAELNEIVEDEVNRVIQKSSPKK